MNDMYKLTVELSGATYVIVALVTVSEATTDTNVIGLVSLNVKTRSFVGMNNFECAVSWNMSSAIGRPSLDDA